MFKEPSIIPALQRLKEELIDDQQSLVVANQRQRDIIELRHQLGQYEADIAEQMQLLKDANKKFIDESAKIDIEPFNETIETEQQHEPQVSLKFIEAINTFRDICMKNREALAKQFYIKKKASKSKAAAVNRQDEDTVSIASSTVSSGSTCIGEAECDNLFLTFLQQLEPLVHSQKYRQAGDKIKEFVCPSTQDKVKSFFQSPMEALKSDRRLAIRKAAEDSKVLTLLELQPAMVTTKSTRVENKFTEFRNELQQLHAQDLCGADVTATSIRKFTSPDGLKEKGRALFNRAKLKPISDLEESCCVKEKHAKLKQLQADQSKCADELELKQKEQERESGMQDISLLDETCKKILIDQVKQAVACRLNKGNYSFWERHFCYGSNGKKYALELERQINLADSFCAAADIVISYIDGAIGAEKRLGGHGLHYHDKSLSTYLLESLYGGIFAPRNSKLEPRATNPEAYRRWLVSPSQAQRTPSVATVAVLKSITCPTRAYGCGIFDYRKQPPPVNRTDSMAELKVILQEQKARLQL